MITISCQLNQSLFKISVLCTSVRITLNRCIGQVYYCLRTEVTKSSSIAILRMVCDNEQPPMTLGQCLCRDEIVFFSILNDYLDLPLNKCSFLCISSSMPFSVEMSVYSMI